MHTDVKSIIQTLENAEPGMFTIKDIVNLLKKIVSTNVLFHWQREKVGDVIYALQIHTKEKGEPMEGYVCRLIINGGKIRYETSPTLWWDWPNMVSPVFTFKELGKYLVEIKTFLRKGDLRTVGLYQLNTKDKERPDIKVLFGVPDYL